MIQTPLSVGLMGLKLLQQNRSCTQRNKLIVRESTEAIHTSIRILNDLLLFDKVEEGNMVLDKEIVHARSFIVQCLRMFQIQVS